MHEEVRRLLGRWNADAWALFAFASAFETGVFDAMDAREPRTTAAIGERTKLDSEIVNGMLDVIRWLGLVEPRGEAGWVLSAALAGSLAGPARVALQSNLRTLLLQGGETFSRALGRRLSRGWQYTDPILLEAQGAMSAGFIELILTKLVPQMTGMSDRLASDSGAFLDVGAGVGRVSIELCRRLPRLRAVGLEPFDAPLALARANVEASGFGDRIELRRTRVEEMGDRDAFDLAWLPAPFMSAEVVRSGLRTMLRALRPGGWLITGTYPADADDLPHAVLRLGTVMSGGDAFSPEELARMTEEAEFVDVRLVPGPPSIPARMIIAQKRA